VDQPSKPGTLGGGSVDVVGKRRPLVLSFTGGLRVWVCVDPVDSKPLSNCVW
jgi:hypothetical protein